MPPTKWNAARWATEIAPEPPHKPKRSPKRCDRQKRRTGSLGAFLRGETRAEMIRRFQSKGVVFAPEELALSTPELRRVGRGHLETTRASIPPEAA